MYRPLLLVAGLALGCSHSPSAPTDAQPNSLSVGASSSTLTVGSTVSLSATATLPDGTATVVTSAVQWLTDTPSVITVVASGIVTGRAPGRANVIATYRGVSGSAPLAVVPDVSGQWRGTGHATRCTGFSDFRTCSRFVPEGSTGVLTLTLTQSADLVSGTIELSVTPPVRASMASPSAFVGSVSGSVLDDGTLALEGMTRQRLPNGNDVPSGTILGWRTKQEPDRSASGSFTHSFPSNFGISIGRIDWAIDRLSR